MNVRQQLRLFYAKPHTTRRYIRMAFIISALLWIAYLLYPSRETERITALDPGRVSSQTVTNDLMQVLSFINNQTVLAPIESHKEQRVAKVKRSVLQADHILGIDPKRLKMSSLVFQSKPQHAYQAPIEPEYPRSGQVTIQVGELLHATLESGLQSDLPGPVRAVLAEPIRSFRSNQVILPRGSRIIGHYQSAFFRGQSRIGIHWDSVIRPDGVSFHLNSPTVGPLGQTGVAADQVKTHFWSRFGEASLVSLIAAGSSLSGGMAADSQTAGQVMRDNVGHSFSDTAASVLNQQRSQPPTAYLNPGARIIIFVQHPIILEKSWKK